ncbi:hypothetical protein LJC31_06670 [Synergistaceae bacterium OttesenSCG-928-I11]|nr:hypothetical protein [Synergistaceae bacterium OttesenSCG-928-I11]
MKIKKNNAVAQIRLRAPLKRTFHIAIPPYFVVQYVTPADTIDMVKVYSFSVLMPSALEKFFISRASLVIKKTDPLAEIRLFHFSVVDAYFKRPSIAL